MNDRLESWKEIAAYLDRDVRTVRRWEKDEGLPIHRHVHGQRATIYAFPSEIDTWLEEKSEASNGLNGPSPLWKSLTAPGWPRVISAGLLISFLGVLWIVVPDSWLRQVGGLDAPGMEQLTAFRFTSGKVSPDGRKLAYLEALHSYLWVRDLTSDQDQVLVAERVSSALVWFRDSRKLAYSIQQGRHRSVEWIDLEERKRNSIWQGAGREAPRPLSWSPDGDQLVCRRRLDGSSDQELSSFPLDGGEPVRLTPIPRRAGSLSLSPDSKFISYSVWEKNGAPNLFLLTVGKNEEPLQLTNHPGADLNPTWSWDSRVLFFVRGWDTQLNRAVWAIRVGDRPGKPIRIGPAGDFSPAGGFSVGLNGDLFL